MLFVQFWPKESVTTCIERKYNNKTKKMTLEIFHHYCYFSCYCHFPSKILKAKVDAFSHTDCCWVILEGNWETIDYLIL